MFVSLFVCLSILFIVLVLENGTSGPIGLRVP